jgi:hypothetical protein
MVFVFRKWFNITWPARIETSAGQKLWGQNTADGNVGGAVYGDSPHGTLDFLTKREQQKPFTIDDFTFEIVPA